MFAVVPGYAPGQAQGLVGQLSGATNAGATYWLSARVAVSSSYHSATFDVRLRNSANSAQSAILAHTSITYTGNWLQIAARFTSNATYDRIVIRTYQEGGQDLVDDVTMCESATQTRACVPSASNLVQNPSFEQVVGTATPWGIYDITTTDVPHWAELSASGASYVDQYGGWLADGPLVAFQGTNYANLAIGDFGDQDSGIVGSLSPSTTVGTTYVLSAMITRGPYAWLQPSTFELRLRNGATGAESPPVAQASSTFLAGGWVTLSGVITITTGTSYNQVEVRYYSDANQAGYVDDVQLCVATATVTSGGLLPWLFGAVALAGVILAGLIFVRKRASQPNA
jgi:hypothetical protein